MRFMLFVLCGVSLAFSQIRSQQDAADIITQPSMCIRGDSIKFTSNQYLPYHFNKDGVYKAVKSCKGAVLLPTGTAGYLAVHPTGNKSDRWYKMYLNNDGVPVGFDFDAVGDSTKGTTVARDTSLYLFPRLYKQP